MSADPAARPPTLAAKLMARIGREGPIGVADYMDACLNDPEHGYYRSRPAIGRGGDFITAPEISQAFGELIGLWCAVVWHGMGAPPCVHLIELGPGRGTLMRDALRAARAVPAFRAAVRVRLVETNAALRGAQRDTLAAEDVPIAWSDDLGGSAVAGGAIVIANEFLDTLPVAQWIYEGGRWRERCVGVDGTGRLCFLAGETAPELPLPAGLAPPFRDGDIHETRAPALAELAAKLVRLSPLAALFIDYGHMKTGLGDTLQGVAGQAHVSPFHAPGETDLSVHVDFERFAAECRGAGLDTDGPLPQGEFLGRLGIMERASRLMAANPDKALAIETGVARIMAPSGMGSRFKAIGLSTGLAPLPGFA
jgi:SAM-dependent MidA family methyltransferase